MKSSCLENLTKKYIEINQNINLIKEYLDDADRVFTSYNYILIKHAKFNDVEIPLISPAILSEILNMYKKESNQIKKEILEYFDIEEIE